MTADNIVRTVVLPAVRGQIRDHKGRVLATMVPSYDVQVLPSQLTHECLPALARNPRPRRGARADLGRHSRRGRAGQRPDHGRGRGRQPRRDGATRNLARQARHPRGCGAAPSLPVRHAGRSRHRLHQRGLGRGTASTRKDEGYRSGDTIGRTGIERQWEPYLRGQKGFERSWSTGAACAAPTCASPIWCDGPISQSAVAGQQLVLTLDMDLQRIVERALRGSRAAAAVVLDMETGRILAHGVQAQLRPQLDVARPLARSGIAHPQRSAAPLPRQGPVRHLQPRLDLQGHHRGHRTGREADHSRGQGHAALATSRWAGAASAAPRSTRRSTCTTPSCRAATCFSTTWVRGPA